MANLRYVDAATVSDEHGKGVEILRQQVVDITGAAGTKVVMVAEVDMLIRNIQVSLVGGTAATAGTLDVVVRPSGGTATTILDDYDLTDVAANATADAGVSAVKVSRGSRVEVTWAAVAATARVFSVHIGWMPDMFSIVDNPRSYSLPN